MPTEESSLPLATEGPVPDQEKEIVTLSADNSDSEVISVLSSAPGRRVSQLSTLVDEDLNYMDDVISISSQASLADLEQHPTPPAENIVPPKEQSSLVKLDLTENVDTNIVKSAEHLSTKEDQEKVALDTIENTSTVVTLKHSQVPCESDLKNSSMQDTSSGNEETEDSSEKTVSAGVEQVPETENTTHAESLGQISQKGNHSIQAEVKSNEKLPEKKKASTRKTPINLKKDDEPKSSRSRKRLHVEKTPEKGNIFFFFNSKTEFF